MCVCCGMWDGDEDRLGGDGEQGEDEDRKCDADTISNDDDDERENAGIKDEN